MNASRFKLLIFASLAFSLLSAAAQQISSPTLGNERLARQRSTRFLAERGIVSSARRHFPTTNSPARMLSDARAHYRSLVHKLSSSAISVPTWQPLGPAQVLTSTYGPVTGRVTSIAADPSDPTHNTVYVGTATGGVWKSTNAAGPLSSITFLPLTDSAYSAAPSGTLPSLSIGSLSVQPVAPGAAPVLLAGTGEANDTTASYFGSGILRSIDGGAHWTVITKSSDYSAGYTHNFDFSGNGFAGFAWGTVGGNPVVVAAVSSAAQGIELSAGTNQSVLGIYFSTNLGQTWFMATITDPGGAVVQSPATLFVPCSGGTAQSCGNAVTSIVWNPVRKVFLAAVRFHGYYESADGQTWTRLPSQPGANLIMGKCPSNNGYSGSSACPIFNGALAVQPVTGDTFALTTDVNNLDQGLWQDSCSANPGDCASGLFAFTQINDAALDAGSLNPSQPTLIPQADYDLYLAAVPSGSDTLLFAGTADIFRCDLGAGCAWRNTTHAQSSDCNSAHVAPAQFAIDATFGASGLLYFGNDGGLWRSIDDVNQQGSQCSPDDSKHFQNLNSAFTGSISDVEALAPDPTNPQNMMASLGPLGTAAPMAGGGAEWQQVLNGEGDYAAIDPLNPQNWYATSEFGVGINLCTTGPSCGIAAFGSPVIASADVANDGYGQTIPAPWILDPQNSSNIILGTCRVWRGPAAGGLQTAISPMLDSNSNLPDDNKYCNGDAEIRSLAASGSPSDASGSPERIYAGMAGLYDGGSTIAGHVFAQTVGPDATASPWVDLSNNEYRFNPYGFDISSIYVDPHSPGHQTIYVTVQGVGLLHVYQSTDGGSIWQDLSRGLPNAPANSIVVDPNDANTVYIATDAGVYYTQNVSSCAQSTSTCWSVFGASLPNTPVTQLSAVNTSSGPALLAATYGRGIWQINLPSPAMTTATVQPSTLTFSSQAVGTASAPQQVLVQNTGAVPLQVSRLSVTGDFTEMDTCSGQSIAPGNACTVQVRFAPTQSGAESGILTIYGSLSSGGQITVPLTGTGVSGAAIVLMPSSLCFQATLVGQTTSTPCGSASAPPVGQSITISNTGATTATLTSISVSGDFAILTNTCGSSLTPANTSGDSCTVSVTFTPAASGNRAGVLTVLDSAGTQTAQLSGIGQSAATDTLTPVPLSFDFKSVAIGMTSTAQQITMTNTGDQAVQNISLSSPSGYVVTNDCGAALAGHSACAILVSFAPVSLGADSQTLAISDIITRGSSSSPHTQSVALTGIGTAPLGIVSIFPNPLNFGYYAINQSSPPQLITLTNNSSAFLAGITSTVTGDFTLQPASSNPCQASLPSGASCNFAVVFSPTQVNARTGRLTVTAAGLKNPFLVTLSGSGAAFTIDGPASELVSGGQSGVSYAVGIHSVNGSTGPVALSCSVQPAIATCSVNPSSVILTGLAAQSASVSFTVGQKAQAAGSNRKKIGLVLTLLLPFGLIGGRTRKWRALVACLLLILILPIGCGVTASAGGGPGGDGGSTASATYTLTVTGSVPGLSRTAVTQINVE